MRLFFACELPEFTRRHLAELAGALRMLTPAGSWVSTPNLHLTLRFLGEVDDPSVAPLCQKVAALPQCGSLHLRCESLAFLPSPDAARVLSVAVGGNLDNLKNLQASIESVCRQAGYPAERRAYLPHITLARFRHGLAPAMASFMDQRARRFFPGPAFENHQLSLMQSIPDRGSVKHLALAHWPI